MLLANPTCVAIKIGVTESAFVGELTSSRYDNFLDSNSSVTCKLYWPYLSATINNLINCENRIVIQFLLTKSNSTVEIHRQLCEGPNVMSDTQ